MLVALAGIIFLIYANGLNTPFQSDGERPIQGSSHVKNPSYCTNLPNIRNRHINGLIHIGSTFLVFFITRLTIGKGTSWGEDAAQKIALITALLFGLHPIQTETVTYISGRPGGLAGLFYFLSLSLFILASLKDCKVPRPVLYLLSHKFSYGGAGQRNRHHPACDDYYL